MKRLGSLALLALAACTSQQDHYLPPIFSPPIRDIYIGTIEYDEKRRLPDPGTSISLQLKDASVATVLKAVSGLADIPLSLDSASAKKSRQVHMSICAHKAPLDTVLLWCGRALNARVTWWPREPLVWIGNSPPPIGRHHQFRAWPLDAYLTEFQITNKREVINWSTDNARLTDDISRLNRSIEKTRDSMPEVPTLAKLLKSDPILEVINATLGTSHSTWTTSWPDLITGGVTPLLKSAATETIVDPDNPTQPDNQLIDYILNDKSFGKDFSDVPVETRREWISALALEVAVHPETSILFENLNPRASSEKDKSDSARRVRLLEEAAPEDRLKLYRDLDLLRKIRFRQGIVRAHAQAITNHARTFAKSRDDDYDSVLSQLKKNEENSHKQIQTYLTTRDREANLILRHVSRLAGGDMPLHVMGRGQILVGTVYPWQAGLVDDYLLALTHPEELSIQETRDQTVLRQERLRKARRKLVNNNLRAVPLEDVLIKWSSESSISMAWVSDTLPAMGQRLVNRDYGKLPFEDSLRSLGRRLKLPPPQDDGDGCLWLGPVGAAEYAYPLPIRLRTLRIPPSLRKESASYLIGWLMTAINPDRGLLTSTSDNLLLFALPRRYEERAMSLLAEAAAAGKLPSATVMPDR